LQSFSRRFDLGWSEMECASSRVAIERTIDTGRRIDIVVACKTKSIAIENKPWAGDQRDQVHDYLDWLARERGSWGEGSRLI
ncbi:PD-(D/E)XK nuclease family protein, partial [Stenotrophomonas maltophilia]|uniref:PD-(D/E)XK nuclease family protein n=1 Tax=Stenotrophomonas maltophilia TaxID=40324 RepID=UPI0013D9D1EB